MQLLKALSIGVATMEADSAFHRHIVSPWPSNHKLFFVTAVKIYH